MTLWTVAHQAGSSVHRILQIRILERVAISFSKERVYLNAKKMMYFKKIEKCVQLLSIFINWLPGDIIHFPDAYFLPLHVTERLWHCFHRENRKIIHVSPSGVG